MSITRRVALLPALAAVFVPPIFISGCGQTEARTIADKLSKEKSNANKIENLLAARIDEQADYVSTILTTLVLERDLHLNFPVGDKTKAQKISQEITSVRANLDKELFTGTREPSLFGTDAKNLQKLIDLIMQSVPIINKVLKDSPEYNVLDRDLQEALTKYRINGSSIHQGLFGLRLSINRHDNLVPKLTSEKPYKPIWGFSRERLEELDAALPLFLPPF